MSAPVMHALAGRRPCADARGAEAEVFKLRGNSRVALQRLALAAALCSLGGCSWVWDFNLPGSGPPPEPTLADLKPAEETEGPILPYEPGEEEQVPEVDLAQLEQYYREVLVVAEDPELRFEVRRRLADLQMMANEAQGAEEPGAVSYAGVIESYESLLREYPEAAGSDQLVYQMARAYDMEGRGDRAVALMEQLSEEYPESEHLAEAEFRKGEAYFAAGNYLQAELAYNRVVQTYDDNDYYANGLYMLGWSRFKQDAWPESAAAFVATLDELMPADNRLESMARGDREMAADCLRALAVMYSYQGGGDAIAAGFRQMGERPYQHLVYLALGELYLEQERYQDSASTFAGFIAEHPESPVAHEFQWQAIRVYEAGGFPEKVIEAKADYVASYSVLGPYWAAADDTQRDIMRPRLQEYVDQLARYHHELAQAGELPAARDDYFAAADYYGLYVDSFPEDETVPEKMFLMAEAREAGGDLRQAIADYQRMAYRFTNHGQAPEAAYAALLAYDRLDDLSAEEQAEQVDSQLRFAYTFAWDERAPVVLGRAAASLLAAQDYPRAVDAATDLTQWQPYPGDELVIGAWRVLGHGQFESANYAQAEHAYGQLLARLPAGDARRADAQEQLAASIYRQGEAASASGDPLLAAGHYARVIELAPTAEIRRNAQYDAATSYRAAGELDSANALLVDFRQRFPDNALSAGIGAILVENYEAQSDWQSAARELDRIHADAADPEVQRESLYLAADYYLRAGDEARAIERLRSYAHGWPQPLAPRMEAMLTLADLYGTSGETDKRQYWLNAMADAHDSAGAQATDRSRYLAASAVSELADDAYAGYTAIALVQPLEQSLRRKRDALRETVDAYERVNDYGLQEFGTRATFRLGEVYRELSSGLMDSERPAQLDALALEQYELLLEEQAFPFEEKAVAIHAANAERAWDGLYDEWIEGSFAVLGELQPARWGKRESRVEYSRGIR
ncbi:tetratricopeptide repeat protein [Mangrovimicrobium sediminis]|uniref:Tetratricopeptide repeat protein n=1 Tax=Mangrovimicrobium sediminis TaxID=2562682 RepID=A0A4Z0M8A5_9GAMM|nr:tetratricopeptide repeat protein [Haliea sp. SAOS-164]TGD75630.1 tetratricopeptide repeat protein [Haliea sp. SAOS-164]